MCLITLFLFIIASETFVSCFNFDTKFPLVYTDPSNVLAKYSDRSNYFGYSVILHGEHNMLHNSWIQIGAPRATSVDNRNKTRELGVIFRCKIFGPCTSIDVNSDFSSTDGAWIGSTMDIDETSSRAVVCGYRWVTKKRTEYWMRGLCYWSHLNDTSSTRLMPLVDDKKSETDDKTTGKRVFYYAQGQAGFSAHFSASKNESELLLGAPGVFNWNGASVIYRDRVNYGNRLRTGSSCLPVKPGAAQYDILNIGNSVTTSQISALGLFGYSSSSGYFFKKDEVLYVSGAPGFGIGMGKVLVYKFAALCDQALRIEDIKQGHQLGEYFGAALAAGDINYDGLDDLIVGAPFYAGANYNEGRVFVFLGSSKGSLEIPGQNPVVYGNEVGGQFGACIMYLGDLFQEGYGVIAVSAPYENNDSGVVYIYKGSAFGLDPKPSQKIIGKNVVPNIKGFGISMSKPTDIDNNLYEDLAIGAYRSGHVVLLRSKPVLTLQQSLISLTPQLYHNGTSFQVKSCFWYFGHQLPSHINITRRIVLDELLHRIYLPDTTLSVEELTLFGNNLTCQNITICIKKNITNYYEPITVTILQELTVPEIIQEVIYVGQTNNNLDDKFCKTCPVANPYTSSSKKTLELTFALDCGDDNLCISQLDLDSKFLNIGTNNQYVLGSTGVLTLETTVKNSGEKAYLVQLVVELPKSVHFQSVPANCLEQNVSSIVLCQFDNPLNENSQKTISLSLDMREVNCEKYIDTLNFTLRLRTSSQNINNSTFVMTLNTVHEADISLIGKTNQQSYSYGNNLDKKSNFIQVFEVEKFGASFVSEVFLTVHIPTQIQGLELTEFLYLYAPEGTHADQSINCQSNAKYISRNSTDIATEFDPKDSTTEEIENADSFTYDITTTQLSPVKRSVRQTDPNLSKQNETSFSNEVQREHPSNRTYYINCSSSAVICSYVKCSIGPFKTKQNLAVVQIKMLFDVSSLSKWLGNKDVIILSTESMVTIRSPPNFIQSGSRPDIARVSSVFVQTTPIVAIKASSFMKSLAGAIIVGLLLLQLLIMALMKIGFFQRTKKLELQALIKAAEAEEPRTACASDEDDSKLSGNLRCSSFVYEDRNSSDL